MRGQRERESGWRLRERERVRERERESVRCAENIFENHLALRLSSVVQSQLLLVRVSEKERERSCLGMRESGCVCIR